MAKPDIRNYLEKIYNVKVVRVNTRIQIGMFTLPSVGWGGVACAVMITMNVACPSCCLREVWLEDYRI